MENLKKMKSFFEKIENLKTSFGYSILIFCFAIFLRTFFENFTNKNNLGMINGFIDTFFHYPIWFLTIFFGLTIVVSIFSMKPISKVLKITSLGSFIIILPPIIDLFYYQYKISYNFITGDWIEISKQYFSLFISTPSLGVGVKTEVILVLIGIFYYVYVQNKNIIKSLIAVWISYSIIFAMLILPNIIYLFSSFFYNLPEISLQNIHNYFVYMNSENTTMVPKTYLSNMVYSNIKFEITQNIFSTILSEFSLYILILFFTCSSLLHFGLNKFIIILKNFRWLRITHYFLLITLGIVLGLKNTGSHPMLLNIYDCTSIFSMFLALACAWLFAVWENDEEDKDIDSISNKKRPLVNGVFSKMEWKNIKWSFFITSLTFAMLSGYTTFILILFFIIIYHIYSIKPLRLKMYPIISSVLVSVNACIAFLLGFFIVSGNQPFNIIPSKVLIGLFIFFVCAENIKNLKDTEGDTANGVLTIPVIFGIRKGKFITWISVLIGSFAIPFLIFPENKIFLAAPIFAIFSYFFIVRKKFDELPLMLFYLFSFVLAIILNM